MMQQQKKRWDLFIVVLLFLLTSLYFSVATPEGPSSLITVSNTTRNITSALILNTSGGEITTVNINVTQTNSRWKAFVGNVTGRLVLQNSGASTLFDWTLTSVAGEVYATRNSTSIIWTNVNCTWAKANSSDTTNRTVERNENYNMNHTSPDDNITRTFNNRSHTSFTVGSVTFPANYCYSIYTNQNDSAQTIRYQEILLYAGTTAYDGDLVYATILESGIRGYDNRFYDFQMIVPEKGISGYASSTAYYFYTEVI